MKNGVYLLVLPGDDFGVPYTLNNNNGTPILAGVDGVKLVANLPPGYQLIPMIAATPQRVQAIKLLLDQARDYMPGVSSAKTLVRTLLEDVEP